MPKAILKGGVIYPLDPLPPEWTDGTELWVESTPSRESEETIDRQFQELEAAAAQVDPADVEIIEAALRDADQQAKALMRRETGLSCAGVVCWIPTI
jgi:hypothetical protein